MSIKRKIMTCLVVLVCFIFLFLLLINPTLIISHIYIPPAIESEHLSVYKDLVNFLRVKDELYFMRIAKTGKVSVNNNIIQKKLFGVREFFLQADFLNDVELSKYFSEKEIESLKKINNQLFEINCICVDKIDSFILFVPPSYYFKTAKPGVLYSFNGENPNSSNDNVIKLFVPYTKLQGNWYFSKKLFYPSLRLPGGITIPDKALLDRSSHIDKPTDLEMK